MRTIRHLTRSTRTRLRSARRDQRGITTAEYAVGRTAQKGPKRGLTCDNDGSANSQRHATAHDDTRRHTAHSGYILGTSREHRRCCRDAHTAARRGRDGALIGAGGGRRAGHSR